jgi:glycosyltransferase involved in cell wall biosynthesis
VKFLFPSVTVILVSHMKPYLREALSSVVGQTRTDIQVLVLDSGQWINRDDERSAAMAKIYEDYQAHPLVEWVFTGEDPELRREVCPIAFVTNEAIRAGLVRGRYVCTFYDDDVYAPVFVERMAGFLDAHPEARAVWCSQDRVAVSADGSSRSVGQIMATGPRYGPTFDCQVDGAQVMFRRDVLDEIGDPWLPENPGDSCRHSDGIFLDKLGTVCGVVPHIAEVLLAHRFTPISTYTPSTI